jgi:hypothetical protein
MLYNQDCIVIPLDCFLVIAPFVRDHIILKQKSHALTKEERKWKNCFFTPAHSPKHIRGGWSHYTDTSEPADAYGAENMVTVQSGFRTSDLLTLQFFPRQMKSYSSTIPKYKHTPDRVIYLLLWYTVMMVYFSSRTSTEYRHCINVQQRHDFGEFFSDFASKKFELLANFYSPVWRVGLENLNPTPVCIVDVLVFLTHDRIQTSPCSDMERSHFVFRVQQGWRPGRELLPELPRWRRSKTVGSGNLKHNQNTNYFRHWFYKVQFTLFNALF